MDVSLANKLMGQVNAVALRNEECPGPAARHSTTGLAAQYPSPGSAIITTVNAAVEAFVRAAGGGPVDIRAGQRGLAGPGLRDAAGDGA